MNATNLDQAANLIWDKLFSKDGKQLTKQQQIQIIKTVVYDSFTEGKKLGRVQILNHFRTEIQNIQQ